ncbi:MAG: arylsulfatase [Planctomycetaceae bacterium]|nr:arylsulfatase [Planctomycetaceae bacterium]
MRIANTLSPGNLFLFLLLLQIPCLAEEPVPKPNVILILADDLALGDLSFLNEGLTRTPHIDRLKSESIWFSQAYSASAVCAPARAALLTGRYPHRTGVVTLNQITYPNMTSLKKDEVTLGNIFQQNGYKTGLIGKWHCGLNPEHHPYQRGFDEFEGFINHKDVPSYFRYRLRMNDRIELFEDKYLTTDLGERAIQFVRRHREEPFFLHLAHYAPHRPIEAPEDRVTPYLKKGFSEEIATVYAMVEIMDETIGQLMAELDRLNLSGNTLVIFASDNGPDPVVESRFNLELRGTKYTIHEGGIRVPLMIRWTDHFDPGTRQQVVHFTDITPTLMELCHLKRTCELPLDGASFAPLLRGDTTKTNRPLYWQWNRGVPRYTHNAAIREGDWKLVRPFVTRNLPKQDSDQPPLLFHLKSDPHEQDNLANQHPGRVTRMQNLLETWALAVEESRQRP